MRWQCLGGGDTIGAVVDATVVRVFIAFASEQTRLAEEIDERLRAEGHRSFLAREAVAFGDG